jgi:hypothetical protein
MADSPQDSLQVAVWGAPDVLFTCRPASGAFQDKGRPYKALLLSQFIFVVTMTEGVQLNLYRIKYTVL